MRENRDIHELPTLDGSEAAVCNTTLVVSHLTQSPYIERCSPFMSGRCLTTAARSSLP
jgi:hypothetical protein